MSFFHFSNSNHFFKKTHSLKKTRFLTNHKKYKKSEALIKTRASDNNYQLILIIIFARQTIFTKCKHSISN